MLIIRTFIICSSLLIAYGFEIEFTCNIRALSVVFIFHFILQGWPPGQQQSFIYLLRRFVIWRGRPVLNLDNKRLADPTPLPVHADILTSACLVEINVTALGLHFW